MRSRTAKRPGPLPHQQRLHIVASARQREKGQIRYWDAASGYQPSAGSVTWAFPGADTEAAVIASARQAALGSALFMATQAASAWAAVNAPAAPLAPQTEPSSLCPRPISITDLDDRIVIRVGFAELRLAPEEAARLFAMGRGLGGKPQA